MRTLKEFILNQHKKIIYNKKEQAGLRFYKKSQKITLKMKKQVPIILS